MRMKSRLLAFATVCMTVTSIGCLCGPCKQAQANRELVVDAFQALADGDLDALDQYIAADYVRHCQASPDVEVTSLEEFKAYLRRERESFPDPEMSVMYLVAEGDLVAFWATYGGVQDGPMGPFPATGKRMEVDFAGIHRIADGKIAETWVTWDNLSGLTQLGLYPPPPRERPPADE